VNKKRREWLRGKPRKALRLRHFRSLARGKGKRLARGKNRSGYIVKNTKKRKGEITALKTRRTSSPYVAVLSKKQEKRNV